jgi:hypothetical protein
MIYKTIICAKPEHVQEDLKITLRNSECYEELASCCDMLIQNVLKTYYVR